MYYGSEFINDTMLRFCVANGIEFTQSPRRASGAAAGGR